MLYHKAQYNTDDAPVFARARAAQVGLGWACRLGLISRKSGLSDEEPDRCRGVGDG